jgi:type IV secretory pathway TrbL component
MVDVLENILGFVLMIAFVALILINAFKKKKKS